MQSEISFQRRNLVIQEASKCAQYQIYDFVTIWREGKGTSIPSTDASVSGTYRCDGARKNVALSATATIRADGRQMPREGSPMSSAHHDAFVSDVTKR